MCRQLCLILEPKWWTPEDFWNRDIDLYEVVWTCGPVDLCTCGPEDLSTEDIHLYEVVWTCGPVDLWTCGLVDFVD